MYNENQPDLENQGRVLRSATKELRRRLVPGFYWGDRGQAQINSLYLCPFSS